MNNPALIIGGIIIAIAAAILGFLIRQHLHGDNDEFAQQHIPAQTAVTGSFLDVAGQQRPLFSLPDLDGNRREISEWDDRVLVINFWATWCPPCRDEIPEFIELQKQYGDQGLQFIGIAMEKADQAEPFSKELGINYPVLVGELDAIKIAEMYGNRVGALPYTVIIDRNKIIRHVQKGVLSHAEAERIIRSLL